MSRLAGKPIPSLWCILSVALLIRSFIPILAYFYTHDVTIFQVPDTASYVEPARQLIAQWSFLCHDGTPEIIRTPGYPILLVLGLSLDRLDLVTITLQILISCFTVYLVYRTADLVFESRGSRPLSSGALCRRPSIDPSHKHPHNRDPLRRSSHDFALLSYEVSEEANAVGPGHFRGRLRLVGVCAACRLLFANDARCRASRMGYDHWPA